MPTVSTLKSTSTISGASKEKAPDVVKPPTTQADVKKVEEVVVPEVKRVDVANISSAANTTATTTAKESVVVEKPKQEVPKMVPKEVK